MLDPEEFERIRKRQQFERIPYSELTKRRRRTEDDRNLEEIRETIRDKFGLLSGDFQNVYGERIEINTIFSYPKTERVAFVSDCRDRKYTFEMIKKEGVIVGLEKFLKPALCFFKETEIPVVASARFADGEIRVAHIGPWTKYNIGPSPSKRPDKGGESTVAFILGSEWIPIEELSRIMRPNIEGD